MTDVTPLRLALRLNAAFSTLSALALLLGHTPLAALLGVESWILLGVGAGLAAFAAYLLITAARQDVAKLRAEALRHSLADFAWVVASIALIVSGLVTPAGSWLLAAVAVPVLALGLAQFRGLPPRPGEKKSTAAPLFLR